MTSAHDPDLVNTGFITVHTQVGDIELPTPATVADALKHPALHAEHVATALNGLFVPRERRDHQVLQHGDTLLCFQAITGG